MATMTRAALVLLLLSSAGDAVEPRSTVVVELFTSEGCSSCPRADVLLGELIAKSWQGGEVYGLAFHVDYWDRLGWKDRFSDGAFTKRQYEYAKHLPDSRVYTPQMIVDGRTGFVGGNRSGAIEAVEAALSESDKISVDVSVESRSDDTLNLRYAVSPMREGLDISAALAQRQAATDVTRGENDGRVLHHSNVVRSFKHFSAGVRASGDTRLHIPDDVSGDELDVVVYVQDRQSLTVLGAARISLKGD